MKPRFSYKGSDQFQIRKCYDIMPKEYMKMITSHIPSICLGIFCPVPLTYLIPYHISENLGLSRFFFGSSHFHTLLSQNIDYRKGILECETNIEKPDYNFVPEKGNIWTEFYLYVIVVEDLICIEKIVNILIINNYSPCRANQIHILRRICEWDSQYHFRRHDVLSTLMYSKLELIPEFDFQFGRNRWGDQEHISHIQLGWKPTYESQKWLYFKSMKKTNMNMCDRGEFISLLLDHRIIPCEEVQILAAESKSNPSDKLTTSLIERMPLVRAQQEVVPSGYLGPSQTVIRALISSSGYIDYVLGTNLQDLRIPLNDRTLSELMSGSKYYHEAAKNYFFQLESVCLSWEIVLLAIQNSICDLDYLIDIGFYSKTHFLPDKLMKSLLVSKKFKMTDFLKYNIREYSEEIQLSAITSGKCSLEFFFDQGVYDKKPPSDAVLKYVFKNIGLQSSKVLDNYFPNFNHYHLLDNTFYRNSSTILHVLKMYGDKLPREFIYKAVVENPELIWEIIRLYVEIDSDWFPSSHLKILVIENTVDLHHCLLQWILSKHGEKELPKCVQVALVHKKTSYINNIIDSGICPDSHLLSIAYKNIGKMTCDEIHVFMKSVIEYGIIPSENVQIIASQKCPDSIQYILGTKDRSLKEHIHWCINNNFTEQVQCAAVSRKGSTIKFIIQSGIVPTRAIQRIAIKKDPSVRKFIKDNLCFRDSLKFQVFIQLVEENVQKACKKLNEYF